MVLFSLATLAAGDTFAAGGLSYLCARTSATSILVQPQATALPISLQLYDFLGIAGQLVALGYLAGSQLSFATLNYEIRMRSSSQLQFGINRRDCTYEPFLEQQPVATGGSKVNQLFSGVACEYFSAVSPTNSTGTFNLTFSGSETLQAAQYVGVGLLNSTWLTPRGKYALPVYPNQTASTVLKADFSFVPSIQPYPDPKVVGCIVLLLKAFAADGSFPSTYPSSEIFVCPYWSGSVDAAQDLGWFQSPNLGYSIKKRQSCSPTFTCWNTYTFMAWSKTTSLANEDLMVYVRQAITLDASVGTLALVGICAGVRIYYGIGSVDLSLATFSSPQEVIAPVTPPNSGTNPNPNPFPFPNPYSRTFPCPLSFTLPFTHPYPLPSIGK